MRVNLAIWDRWIRLFFCFFGITWWIAGGPWWLAFSLYLLLTGSWGYCPILAHFDISTYHLKKSRDDFGL